MDEAIRVGRRLGHGGEPRSEEHRHHRRGEGGIRPVVEVPTDAFAALAHDADTVRRRMTQAPRLRYYPRMPGRLDPKQLEQLIKKGEIDTVLTVFPDTFGRLLGKRVVGSYWRWSRCRASSSPRGSAATAT